ncbi:hypothetical protein ACFE04_029039 [Oxalis oulophora]
MSASLSRFGSFPSGSSHHSFVLSVPSPFPTVSLPRRLLFSVPVALFPPFPSPSVSPVVVFLLCLSRCSPSLSLVPFVPVTPRRSPATCWLGRNEGSKKKSKLLDRLKLRLELCV